MAKQLTAPGCKYSIVARVDTTIYSPDQTWTLDVSAGQTDFIAETNEIIIPADAMMCRKKGQIDADLARFNVLGRGAGSLATFITRAVEQIVGKGNAKVEYGDGKLTVALAFDTTEAQIVAVENLLERLLPKDVAMYMAWADGLPMYYTRLAYLESTGTQRIEIRDIQIDNDLGGRCDYVDFNSNNDAPMLCASRTVNGTPRFYLPYTSNGTGYYGWNDWVELGAYNNAKQRTVSLLNYFNDRKYKMSYGDTVLSGTLNNTLPVVNNQFLSLFCYNSISTYRYVTGKVYSAQLTRLTAMVCSFIPALDPTGTPCMFDTVTRKAFKNAATTGPDFIAGLTSDQALALANLPAAGGSLTVSLPLEVAFDEAVQNALNTAAANGWEITVRYRESELTTEYIEADFLEGTGTQYIDTRIVPSDETGLRLTALPMSDTDTIPFGSRTSNETESRFYAVRPRRLRTGSVQSLVANGFGWGGWLTIGASYVQDVPKKEETYLNWLNARRAISEHAAKYLLPLPFTPELSMYLFAANINNTAQLYYIGRIWAASVSIGTQLKANFIPVIDSSGIPCMRDTVSGQNFYNANTAEGAAPFIVGFETTEKAAISLSKLPVTTAGTLTVSLPAAAEEDNLVDEACRIAESRGWTIITQYRTN